MKKKLNFLLLVMLTMLLSLPIFSVQAQAASTSMTIVLPKNSSISLATTLSSNSAVVATWSSNKTSVAKVDSYGNVTAVNYGVAKITAKYGTTKHYINIRVASSPSSIKLNVGTASLAKGKTYTLKATLSPSTAFSAIKWSSSKTSVATVSSSGVVTAKGVGTAVITANANGKTAKCTVTVTSVKKYSFGGTITNATTGQPLSNATLNFRKGQNTKTGSVAATTSTSSAGKYTVNLYPGYYTMEVKKTGYITTYTNIKCDSKNSNSSTNTNFVSVSVSQAMVSGNYRIVLSWGSSPYDLDSHLTGPVSSGSSSRFHVYFANKTYSSIATLDVDDRSSYGPETITINSNMIRSGTFRYKVHDYSNRNYSNSIALGRSGARVTVYKGNTQIVTYYVPNKVGTCWHVFNIVNGTLKRVNTMSNVSSSSSID